MRAAAELKVLASGPAEHERGGAIGKVQAIVLELPGLTTREIRKQVHRETPDADVSGALNKLVHEGVVEQDRSGPRIRWTRAVEPAVRRGRGPEVFCVGRCGTSILFGSLATAEERARPSCSAFPFAHLGAA